ncbi:hypothetical protein AFCDBAGC_1270 [Methylobacterium cerastii]|uniref:Uncharacterized protein n=1 Tax=Methylobacterium cerastii TaxID=932741 RepID=A0ABQ4QDY0_9HYPH|nr:hypothetical protein AFCDBAGC_1270 [Methylobacterium cerastii]
MPVSASVPAPVLKRRPALPDRSATTPVRVSVPASTWIVPPVASTVTARALVNPAVASSVPPTNAMLPVAAPRLASVETARVPSETVVPPE